jgi:hypothetical protein
MTSAVSICSNALLMNGAQTINALDDSSDRARQCANLYPTVRDYVLSTHPWNCCIKRVLLSPDTDVPAFDWSAQFTLPADFLRLLATGEDGYEPDHMIESGKILMNQSTLKLRYVWKNTVEDTWTPLLIMAVTMAMRQALAYPITQSTSLEQLIDQAIEPILKRARTTDSQDQPPQTLGDFRLLQARFSNRDLAGQ